jgi:hypothetical protein
MIVVRRRRTTTTMWTFKLMLKQVGFSFLPGAT